MTNNGSIATDFLGSWVAGDFETTRSLSHDDITFDGPLGQTRGVDEYIDGVTGLSKIVESADPQEVVADRDQVVLRYDLVTSEPAAQVPTVGWYRIEDDRVRSVRVFFDPRPLTDG